MQAAWGSQWFSTSAPVFWGLTQICVEVTSRLSKTNNTTVYNLCSCLADCDNTLVRRKSHTNGATTSGLFRWTWWSPGAVTTVCWNREETQGISMNNCLLYTTNECVTVANSLFCSVSFGEVLMWISLGMVQKIFYETRLLLWKSRFWTCLVQSEKRTAGWMVKCGGADIQWHFS